MNPVTASNIMSLVQLNYPGGLVAFRAEGGNIYAFPKDERYIICSPKLTKEFLIKMDQGADRFDFIIEYFTTCNFQYESETEAKEWAGKLLRFLKKNLPKSLPFFHPCTIYIDTGSSSNSKEVLALKEFLNQSPEIVRAHIQCKDTLVTIEKERKTKEIQPERARINDDDLLNLKITLHEVNTVEDFLKTF